MRKWVALLIAIASYFIIHEGAHFVYALSTGAFKQIRILGLGVQIEPFLEKMSTFQFGIFNLLGPVSTIVISYILLAMTPKLVSLKSARFRAIGFYMTAVFLLVDPLYLCFLSLFIGGGDMNGIILILPEITVRALAGFIAMINIIIIIRHVLPKYRQSFHASQRNVSGV